MLTSMAISCSLACKQLHFDLYTEQNTLMRNSGFEPDIIPGAMLVHRIIGTMAHWREYTGMKQITSRAFKVGALAAYKMQSIEANYSGPPISIQGLWSR